MTPSSAFRATWDALGDSIVVVGGDGIWNCHVHTDDIGGGDRGRHRGRAPVAASTSPTSGSRWTALEADWVTAAAPVATRPCGVVVAVASGAGITSAARAPGRRGGGAGGPVDEPVHRSRSSTRSSAAGPSRVVVLPNNKNIVAVAEQAAGLAVAPGRRSCPRTRSSRRSRRSSSSTPRRRLADNAAAMSDRRVARADRRGDPGGARRTGRVRTHRRGRLDRHHARRHRRPRRHRGRRRDRRARRARRRPPTSSSRSWSGPTRIPPTPSGCAPTWPRPGPRSRSRSTTAASPSTRSSSGSSDPWPTGRRSRCVTWARSRSPSSKQIGPKLGERLSMMGIGTVLDLLTHYPRRYHDRRNLQQIASLAIGEEATVYGDGEEGVGATHATGALARRDRDLRRHLVPEVHVLQPAVAREAALGGHRGRVLRQGRALPEPPPDDEPGGRRDRASPACPAPTPASWCRSTRRRARPTCRRGRSARRWRRPSTGRRRGGSPTPSTPTRATTWVSSTAAPRSRTSTGRRAPRTRRAAARRLTFDEFLRMQVGLVARKRKLEREGLGVEHVVDGPLVDAFHAALPFPLTDDQTAAIAEIARDLASPAPMHRLLQGEVGSGKTVVALTALLMAVQGGHQGALMAPTEVLAEQHHRHGARAHRRPRGPRAGQPARGAARAGGAAHQPHAGRRAPPPRRRAARRRRSTCSSAPTR